jgi:hypothetical protein
MYVFTSQCMRKTKNKSLIPLLFNSSTWFPSSYHHNKTKNQEFKENFTLLSSSPSSLPLSLFSSGLWKQKDLDLLWSGLCKQLKLMPLTIFLQSGPTLLPFPIWSTAAVHVQCHSLPVTDVREEPANYQLLSTSSSSSSSNSFSPGKVPGTTPLPHKLYSRQE